jgi:hypothetical protein
MGIATFPAAGGGGIKSVQRGLASSSGTVTISSVDISKAFVTVYGTASSGTVAASGSINAASWTDWIPGNPYLSNNTPYINALVFPNNGSKLTRTSQSPVDQPINANTAGGGGANYAITANSTNLSGGSNNLVAAVVQGYLNSSTQLIVSGACRWEVVEFN